MIAGAPSSQISFYNFILLQAPVTFDIFFIRVLIVAKSAYWLRHVHPSLRLF